MKAGGEDLKATRGISSWGVLPYCPLREANHRKEGGEGGKKRAADVLITDRALDREQKIVNVSFRVLESRKF